MNTEFLKTTELPYCKGCGHHLIARNTATGLEKNGLLPLDVILVTDIGCHGIIDKCFNTHTVHGLHGRAVALGAGITLGLSEPKKKIIVFIGDGGVTIGLQHLLEASRLNINMTVILHNNMLYGMTGGQASGLTPCGFKTTITPDGNPVAGYDICRLTHTAGASYVRRIIGRGDFSDELSEAFKINGFSLVEIVEICPSYGVKLNPKIKLDRIIEMSKQETGVWQTKNRIIFTPRYRQNLPSLFEKIPEIKVEFESKLRKPFMIILGGSAGEGVQLAAELLARAAIASGLSVTKKGSYPVTVGVGFSTAEITIAPKGCDGKVHATEFAKQIPSILGKNQRFFPSESTFPSMLRNSHRNSWHFRKSQRLFRKILGKTEGFSVRTQFTSINEPDLIIITSEDGLAHNKERIITMNDGTLIIDESLKPPKTEAEVISHNFREMRPRNAAIYAAFFFAQYTNLISVPALIKVIQNSRFANEIPMDKIKAKLSLP